MRRPCMLLISSLSACNRRGRAGVRGEQSKGLCLGGHHRESAQLPHTALCSPWTRVLHHPLVSKAVRARRDCAQDTRTLNHEVPHPQKTLATYQ